MHKSSRHTESRDTPHRTLTLAGVDRGNAAMVVADVQHLPGVHEVTLALGDSQMHLHVDERFQVAALAQVLSSSGVTVLEPAQRPSPGSALSSDGKGATTSCCKPERKG